VEGVTSNEHSYSDSNMAVNTTLTESGKQVVSQTGGVATGY